MPEAGARRRLGRGTADRRVRLIRWFYRNRPKFAVVAAFAVACLIGLAAASLGIQTFGAGDADAPAPAAR